MFGHNLSLFEKITTLWTSWKSDTTVRALTGGIGWHGGGGGDGDGPAVATATGSAEASVVSTKARDDQWWTRVRANPRDARAQQQGQQGYV